MNIVLNGEMLEAFLLNFITRTECLPSVLLSIVMHLVLTSAIKYVSDVKVTKKKAQFVLFKKNNDLNSKSKEIFGQSFRKWLDIK